MNEQELVYANTLFRNKEYEQAYRNYEVILSRQNAHPFVQYRFGLCLFLGKGATKDALLGVKQIFKAIDAQPELMESLYIDVNELVSECVDVYYLLGEYYRRTGCDQRDYTKALEYYGHALEFGDVPIQSLSMEGKALTLYSIEMSKSVNMTSSSVFERSEIYKCISRAIELGSVLDAGYLQFVSAYCLTFGIGCVKNAGDAMRWANLAYDNGNKNVLSIIVHIVKGIGSDEKMGVDFEKTAYSAAHDLYMMQSYSQAMRLYNEIVSVPEDEMIDSPLECKALLDMADCYYYGREIEMNQKIAYWIFDLLINQDTPYMEAVNLMEQMTQLQADPELFLLLYKYYYEEKKYTNRAVFFLSEAAKWGSMEALKILGDISADKAAYLWTLYKDMEAKKPEAIRVFRETYSGDYDQVNMAYNKTQENARRYYMKAGEAGLAKAYFTMGERLFFGNGFVENYTQAATFFNKARNGCLSLDEQQKTMAYLIMIYDQDDRKELCVQSYIQLLDRFNGSDAVIELVNELTTKLGSLGLKEFGTLVEQCGKKRKGLEPDTYEDWTLISFLVLAGYHLYNGVKSNIMDPEYKGEYRLEPDLWRSKEYLKWAVSLGSTTAATLLSSYFPSA